jgi:hypothetical protein
MKRFVESYCLIFNGIALQKYPNTTFIKQNMIPQQQSPDNTEQPKKGFMVWLKRLGWAGFLFFLVKGLVWLFVLYGGARFLGCGK